jgi:VanZ family protein
VTGPPPAPPPVGTARRLLALLAAASAAFTLYGSLVPFHYRPRPLDDATATYRVAMAGWAKVDSKSDGIANVMLGVPLGFGLLGLFRVGNPNRAGDAAAGAALVPLCVVYAAMVEFAQLYFPGRTCSGSDVLCQGLGSVIGMAGWAVAGRWLVGQAGGVWGGTAFTGRVLAAYVVLLGFVQALPLDLTPSPKDLYKKARDRVRYVPFGEFVDADDSARLWEATAKALKVAGLFLPVGLLASRLPGRFWEGRNAAAVAGAGVVLAGGMEAVQLFVQSRVPSATDVVVGAAGTLLGWLIGRRAGRGLSVESALVIGQVWAAALLVAYWQPFDFRGPPKAFDVMPGMPLESGHPLFALEEIITKLVLFAPFGLLAAAAGTGTVGPGRLLVAAAAGLGVGAVIEVGQLYLPAHTPSITDVLIGGAGAVAAAWLASRLQTAR